MPKDTAASVPTSINNQAELRNPWPVDVDILINILEWLTRENLANFQLVSRFNHTLIDLKKDHLKRGLAPLDCVRVINTTRTRILPGATPISVTRLLEHWPHSNNTIRRLCAVRSLSYFYAPRSTETDQFVKEIVTLTLQASKQPEKGFLKNPYLQELVILTFFIEIYQRLNDPIVYKNNNHEYKLSLLMMHLFNSFSSNNISNWNQINHDPSSICLHYFILCIRSKHIEQIENLFLDFARKLNLQSANYRNNLTVPNHWQCNPFKPNHQQYAISILLPFFIDPPKLSRILPNSPDWSAVTPAYVQTLCNLPQRRSNQLLNLYHGLTAEIINISNKLTVNDFFNQLDALLSISESTLYLSALCYLYKLNEGLFHKEGIIKLQQILHITPIQLQATINNLLKKLNITNLYSQAHVILLLLILRPEVNITIEFLLTLFNSARATCKEKSSFPYIRTAIDCILELDIHLINYLVQNQENKYIITMFRKKTNYELVYILDTVNRSSIGPLFIFLLSKRFIKLNEITFHSTKFYLIIQILKIIPQEQFSKESTKTLMDTFISREKARSKYKKSYIENFTSFFAAISIDATPSIQEIIKVLASPLFDTIIGSTIYTNLYKLIGIDKLASCTELQFNNGQYFKKFIESLEKSSPAKFSAVLPIIKEACTANQEQDLPSRITEFLNTNKDLTPPNASNLLSALGTFSRRKRSNDDSEDAQAKIQKLTPPSPPRKP